jgi:branched-chain amino acid transport system ATP-binding protein
MLEVTGLEVRYGAVRAVRDVSLRVAEGELAVLLGANGAGKSSALKAIAGVIRPSGGRISLDGAEVPYGWPERMVRLGAAMVPETRDVFADLTVDENLKLGGFTRRGDPDGMAIDHARVTELFPVLAERAGQPAGTLSGGEQQMLVIARALMSRPRLLLLDEPSLGLAPTIIDRIFAMIAELKRTGLTILLVEQNAAQGLAVADHAFVMRLGEIAASGPADGIRAATDLKAVCLGG